jgi:hypothetical protein
MNPRVISIINELGLTGNDHSSRVLEIPLGNEAVPIVEGGKQAVEGKRRNWDKSTMHLDPQLDG